MLCVRAWRSVSPLCRGGNSTLWTRTQSRTAAATRLDLSGIYPPIATPFTAKEDVDYQRLEENLQKYAKIPFKGQAEVTQCKLNQSCLNHTFKQKKKLFFFFKQDPARQLAGVCFPQSLQVPAGVTERNPSNTKNNFILNWISWYLVCRWTEKDSVKFHQWDHYVHVWLRLGFMLTPNQNAAGSFCTFMTSETLGTA